MKKWYVKVLFSDGDIISTKICGTKTEVENYYAKGRIFNLGTVYDKMVRVERVLELDEI